MDTLRFITAGNVDDGKSTLTGRLLYDSGNIAEDQLHTVMDGDRSPDLAKITDGLKAEREHGITIDVAYKYFSTATRKFILADAPGHFEYTRNMITGASMTDLVIILVDARNGITEQTRRHSLLASLLGIGHIALVINKMDMVGYSEEVFTEITAIYEKLAESLKFRNLYCIPVSALNGDNVVQRSIKMDWYTGEPLLTLLDKLPVNIADAGKEKACRMYIQYVISDSRETGKYGYAGKIISGTFSRGDRVRILPSGVANRIDRIYLATTEISKAVAGDDVVLLMEEEADIGRGDLISGEDHLPSMESRSEALVFWMDQKPLVAGNSYLLQINTRIIRCEITAILYKLDINTFEKDDLVREAVMNDVISVQLSTTGPLLTDSFQTLPANGRMILIDESSYLTVGACVINY